jgi:hypothetical protein
VIDTLVEDLRVGGRTIVAVRAPFIEGRRIFPQSAFYERGHVQIAVRDRLIIRDVWQE